MMAHAFSSIRNLCVFYNIVKINRPKRTPIRHIFRSNVNKKRRCSTFISPFHFLYHFFNDHVYYTLILSLCNGSPAASLNDLYSAFSRRMRAVTD